MRKLKLQMQMTVDGFVGRESGEPDWMTWNWDEKLKDFTAGLTEAFDTILLGRKMTDGFIDHWTSVIDDPEGQAESDVWAARKFVDTPKVVFSRTLSEPRWPNTTLENNIDAVNQLKKMDGGDIIVYGGADFVSSLVDRDLIDDYYLFINPTAIGSGLTIFPADRALKLVDSTAYECGVVVNRYQPLREVKQ